MTLGVYCITLLYIILYYYIIYYYILYIIYYYTYIIILYSSLLLFHSSLPIRPPSFLLLFSSHPLIYLPSSPSFTILSSSILLFPSSSLILFRSISSHLPRQSFPILISSVLSFSSVLFFLSPLLFFLFCSIFSYSLPHHLIFSFIQSIRVGIWIHLLIFHKNLTPHKLSEWMVEVCRFDKCIGLGLMFRAGWKGI